MRCWSAMKGASFRLGLGVVVGSLAACNNPCQALCVTLADYARECGVTWEEAEITACINRQSNPGRESLRTCRDFGAPDRVRDEWACDDVLLYLTPSSSSDEEPPEVEGG